MKDIEAIKEFKKTNEILRGGDNGNYKIAKTIVRNELAISALEKQLNNGWIPVSERLPEEKGDYLVTYGNGKIMTHWYVSELKCWLNKEWIKQVKGVIAWQPLPEPYTEVAK